MWDAAYPGHADEILSELRRVAAKPELLEGFAQPEPPPEPGILGRLLLAVADSWVAAGMLIARDA